MLGYQEAILSEALEEDGLTVLGRGLGLHSILLQLIRIYSKVGTCSRTEKMECFICCSRTAPETVGRNALGCQQNSAILDSLHFSAQLSRAGGSHGSAELFQVFHFVIRELAPFDSLRN